jgi:hypothetical protein
MFTFAACGKKLTLSEDSLTLYSGDTKTLTATMDSANASIPLKWSSSNTEIATVADDGTVTALSAGVASIFVSAEGYAAKKCGLTVNPSVYVVGYDKDTGNADFVAMLWKNGNPQRLSRGWGVATSVFVSNSDVYVAGKDRDRETIWKNGISQLPGGANAVVNLNSIYVSGSDVYAAASYSKTPWGGWIGTILKNGVPQPISDESKQTHVYSVFISNSDVFAAGRESYREQDGYWSTNVAMQWKNGVGQRLSDGKNFAKGNAVYVSAQNVYVAGCEWGKGAMVWKNGNPQLLSQGNAEASSVFVEGNDVYVTGHEDKGEGPFAMLWKNGNPQRLSQVNSVAESVFVLNGDVFVVGHEYSGKQNQSDEYEGEIIKLTNKVAMLWKNGVPQRLTDGTYGAEARAVFVK